MRVTTLRTKDAEREELEAAMRRFQAAGGTIEESDIIPHREEFLRKNMQEFDRARDVAHKRGKQAEKEKTPAYIRNIRAIHHKAR